VRTLRWSLRGLDAIDRQIYIEHLAQLWQLAGWSVPGQLLGVVVIARVVRQSHVSAAVWAPPIGLILLAWAVCAYWMRGLRHHPIGEDNYTSWRQRTLARGLVHSLAWGWLYFVIWGSLPEQWRTILFGAIMMWCFAALLFSMHDWGQSLVVCVPVTVLLSTRLLLTDNPDAAFLGVFMVAAVATGLGLGRQVEQRLFEGARSRLRNVELAQQLALEVKKTERARQVAEQASEDKSTFLAAASHDLRQPLHNLALLTGLIQKAGDNPAVLLIGERMQTALDGLRSVFDQLFDVARLDAGKQVHQPRPVYAAGMLQSLADEYQGAFAAKGLLLHLSLTPDWVHADPIYLQRILRNLLDNALRYTTRGRVWLRMRRRGDAVAIQVWDTGPGIARPLRERIFNDYVQAHEADGTQTPGLGLGLGVVRRLVEQGRYALQLRSRPGRGSVFSLRVGACAAPEAVMPQVARSDDGGVALDPGTAPLVLIDDDLPSLQALQDTLSAEGWPHWAATDAATAIEAVARSGQWPAGVICDYRLTPRLLAMRDQPLTGLDVIRALRHEFGLDLPAWLLTADRHPYLAQQCADQGITLLHKPINADQLLAALRQRLGPAAAAAMPRV
jgi:signal transduction histidine kinase/CheY-like chemotaxis protein